MTDLDNLYEWLQPTRHFETRPEGPVFVFLDKLDAEYQTPSLRLQEGDVLYESDHYIARGYPSYEALRADFEN